MKYIFLINSFTVKEKINDLIHNIKDYCVKNNINYEIEINNENNSTEKILKKYKKANNIIIPVGGDGIINRTLNSIVNTKNILGFIPHGTGNDFYKSVKKEFKKGINECDLVSINDKYFINTACFGIDADVANNKSTFKSKILPKSQAYNYAVIKSFSSFKSRNFKIETNNEKYEGRYATIVVCNGGYYGSGYYINPHFKLNNNKIDVYFVEHLNKVNLALLILKMKQGKHINDKRVKHLVTDKIIIKSDEKINANIDGESIENNKFEIEVKKNKINIFYDENMIKEIKKAQ